MPLDLIREGGSRFSEKIVLYEKGWSANRFVRNDCALARQTPVRC
jgi:hypothetical protein